MAYYAALVSLVQLLEDIIHCDQYPQLLLDKQQLASIYEKFSRLQTLLDDYSPKDREAFDFLGRRIRDVAYETQDIIEFHISKIKNRTHGVERFLLHLISPLQKAILRCLFPMCFVLLQSNMEKEHQDLEKLKEEVDSIVEELMTINKSYITVDLPLNYYSTDAATSNQASGTSTMVGFEERLTTIKDQLCGEPSKLRVVSIVGMGGIGKTTLARKSFNDELIVYKFDFRAWVTVSQNYHPQKVLLDILDSMNVPTNKSSEADELGEKIYKHLKGRRYFIIMDDMWDTKVWNDVKRILPDDSNGSRIMITTRISNVALYADRFCSYHQMQLLNEEQSWNLFCEKVFCPPELEDIGKLITKKCRGLPLAIVVVAGLLAKENKTRCDWEKIARSVCSVAVENDDNFSKILSLSYNHLPHHLKPCLLYIGGFPEDYKIHVSKLVKLWIAEGFVKPIESKILEAVAEDYLEDLVNRNLVLVTKMRSNGKIKCCGIHDLLRDLCTKIIINENFLHFLHEDYHFQPSDARSIRRLHIFSYSGSGPSFTEAEESVSHVHSIISHGGQFVFFGSGFKLLRVLDAKEGCISRFPTTIEQLYHLKYLTIMIDRPSVPSSICLLQNLQTLNITHSWEMAFCALPSEIRGMPNLRHICGKLRLICHFFNKQIFGEPSILESLQTLLCVADLKFTNEVIEMIPNLRKLEVSCFAENIIEWRKFHLNNLFYLHQLETLTIRFRNFTRTGEIPVPRNFAFPLSLKKLCLERCRIPWKDMTVVGSLPNLQVLKLRNSAFVGEKWEPIEGEFLKLKFLLKIMYCWKLKEIP